MIALGSRFYQSKDLLLNGSDMSQEVMGSPDSPCHQEGLRTCCFSAWILSLLIWGGKQQVGRQNWHLQIIQIDGNKIICPQTITNLLGICPAIHSEVKMVISIPFYHFYERKVFLISCSEHPKFLRGDAEFSGQAFSHCLSLRHFHKEPRKRRKKCSKCLLNTDGNQSTQILI